MTNTSADSTWIQTSYRHGVAWLQFDGSRAFDGTFWTELHNALRGVETSGTCAVALTSDAPAFSVGNSAAWLSYSVGAAARRGDSKTALYAVGDILRRTASEINQLPIPLIAVVSGETVGAGLELACLCDLRVCVDSVQISLPEAHLGVLPDIAPLEVLDEVLGARLSRRLLLTGQQEFLNEATTNTFADYWQPTETDAYQFLATLAPTLANGPVLPALRRARHREDATESASLLNTTLSTPAAFRKAAARLVEDISR